MLVSSSRVMRATGGHITASTSMSLWMRLAEGHMGPSIVLRINSETNMYSHCSIRLINA